MPTPNYRVSLSFDGERKVFIARAPELEHCSGEGATRAEAIAKLEEEIDAQVKNMLAQGNNPPTPVDELRASGELQVKLSASLHRELLWQARQEGVEVSQLAGEMLAAALEGRRNARPPRHNHAPVDPDSIGNRGGPDRNDRGGRGFGGRYNPQLMEDRANFIEYVRNLEHNGMQPGGGRGPSGGGGGGGDRGGRRRRGGGGGGANRGGGGGTHNAGGGSNGNGRY